MVNKKNENEALVLLVKEFFEQQVGTEDLFKELLVQVHVCLFLSFQLLCHSLTIRRNTPKAPRFCCLQSHKTLNYHHRQYQLSPPYQIASSLTRWFCFLMRCSIYPMPFPSMTFFLPNHSICCLRYTYLPILFYLSSLPFPPPDSNL